MTPEEKAAEAAERAKRRAALIAKVQPKAFEASKQARAERVKALKLVEAKREEKCTRPERSGFERGWGATQAAARANLLEWTSCGGGVAATLSKERCSPRLLGVADNARFICTAKFQCPETAVACTPGMGATKQ